MKTKNRWVLSALAAVAAASAAVPSWAAAPAVKAWLNGKASSFSYVTGSYNSKVSTFHTQPWWGGTTPAFSSAFGSQYGDTIRWSDADYMTDSKQISTSTTSNSGLIATEVAAPAIHGGKLSLMMTLLGGFYYLDLRGSTNAASGATVNPVAVPEIDGGKLPLTMMLLGLLYYIDMRRKNRAGEVNP